MNKATIGESVKIKIIYTEISLRKENNKKFWRIIIYTHIYFLLITSIFYEARWKKCTTHVVSQARWWTDITFIIIITKTESKRQTRIKAFNKKGQQKNHLITKTTDEHLITSRENPLVKIGFRSNVSSRSTSSVVVNRHPPTPCHDCLFLLLRLLF